MYERMTYQLDRGRRLLVLAVAIAIWIPSAVGQAPQSGSASPAESASAKLPVYDVVSIKLNKSGSGSTDIDTNDNRYSAKNLSLKDLLGERVWDQEGPDFGCDGTG